MNEREHRPLRRKRRGVEPISSTHTASEQPVTPLASDQHASSVTRVQQELLHLLQSGMNIQRIAALLGAEEYLRSTGRGHRQGWRFDAEQYIKDHAAVAAHLQLPTHAERVEAVILPPDEQEPPTRGGERPFEQKKQFPRTAMMMEILGALGAAYEIIEGMKPEGTVRKTAYVVFFIPSLRVAVFVCNEEGNATFFVHGMNDRDTAVALASNTKEHLRHSDHAPRITTIRWREDGQWKERVIQALQEPPEQQDQSNASAPTAEIPVADVIPPVWATALGVAKKLKKSYSSVRFIVDQYRATHPEWFLRKKGDAKKVWLHPELQRIAEERLLSREDAPEGWKTLSWMEDHFGVGRYWIETRLTPHLAEHPEWQMSFNVPDIGKYPHYAPQAVAIIEAAVREISLPPKNWENTPSVCKTLGISYPTARNLLEREAENHPGQKGEFRNSINHITPFYGTEVVAAVVRDYRARHQQREKKK